MSALIFARINYWVNNGEAGDLRRNRAHYDVTVMQTGMAQPIAQMTCSRVTTLQPESPGTYFNSNKLPYHELWHSLEPARLDAKMPIPLWNSEGGSVAETPAKFERCWRLYASISKLCEILRRDVSHEIWNWTSTPYHHPTWVSCRVLSLPPFLYCTYRQCACAI